MKRQNNDCNENQKKDRTVRIWGDATFHDKYSHIFYAAVVQMEDEDPYLYVDSYKRTVHMNSSGNAEAAGVALVCRHIANHYPDNVLHAKIMCDNLSAISYIKHHGDQAKYDRIHLPLELTESFNSIADIDIQWGNKRTNNYIEISDEAAWWARKGNQHMVQQIAQENDFRLVYVCN